MSIREATENDLKEIAVLFSETIKAVSAKDYNEEQINLWATRDEVFWSRRFNEQHVLVAEVDGKIVGFSSLTDSGYIDFMYVHKDRQRQGIAKRLLAAIEEYGLSIGLSEVHSHVSATAKPFFLSRGFLLLKKQTKKLSDIEFENYAVQKALVLL